MYRRVVAGSRIARARRRAMTWQIPVGSAGRRVADGAREVVLNGRANISTGSQGRGMGRIAATAMAATALLATGCGKDESYQNDPRPPSQIVLSATISEAEVSVSPKRFGAGPVSLIVSNQTGAAQQITFETTGGAGGFMQQTGPINPGDTATLKAEVPEGKATVRVQSRGIEPAVLTVGAARPSARDELLRP